MVNKRIWIVVLLGIVTFFLNGCDAIISQPENVLDASGTVEAIEVSVASEVSGTVVEVLAGEGMTVTEGQPLMRLENDVLQAQLNQTEVGYEGASAGLVAAQAVHASAISYLDSTRIGLRLAELNYAMVTKSTNLAERPAWEFSWDQELPDEFDLPSWYFGKDEEIGAMEKEIDAAAENLRIEQANLKDTLEDISNADFVEIEQRLVEAQAAFVVVKELRDREIEQNGRDAIDEYLQSLFDSAEAELESAQAEYDSVLSEEKAEKVLEARARVDVANERYLTALARSYDLQTGGNSLEVSAAELELLRAKNLVAQAESGVVQAESGMIVAEQALNQAEAALNLVRTQVKKLTVVSPIDGVVLSRSLESGELAQPGISLMVVGKLAELTITVYLPEDFYGQVNLGDTAIVTVDSFPEDEFSATVIRIADKAEYTPRNVQTEEDRRTTVYAVELSLADGENKLKPGMPADVVFTN